MLPANVMGIISCHHPMIILQKGQTAPTRRSVNAYHILSLINRKVTQMHFCLHIQGQVRVLTDQTVFTLYCMSRQVRRLTRAIESYFKTLNITI